MLLKGLNKISSLVVALLVVTFVFSSEDSDSLEIYLLEQWEQTTYSTYDCLGDTSLSFAAYKEALHGYELLSLQNQIKSNQFLTIIDFSQNSSRERLYLIDMLTNTIVKKTLVAHGRNSGNDTARKFSNKSGSNMSSLGFYITDLTYSGKFKLALRLNGLEYSNSKARSRGVVMHGAKYATKDFLNKNGRLGRSLGCPAVPMEEAPEIINTIKEGSLLYIYHPNSSYHKNSRILRNYDFLAAE